MKLKSLTLLMLTALSANVLATEVINHKSPIAAAVVIGVNTCKITALR